MKTTLTGSPYPSLPSSTVVFAQLFLLSWSLKQATLSLIKTCRSLGNVRRKLVPCPIESFPLFGLMIGQIKYRKLPLIISPTYNLLPPPPPSVRGPSTCKQKIHPILSPPRISAPSKCIEMNLIYYEVLKLKTPVNAKRVLISTAPALFPL